MKLYTDRVYLSIADDIDFVIKYYFSAVTVLAFILNTVVNMLKFMYC